MIWLVFVALCLATMTFLALPAIRQRQTLINRADYDLTVYKDQLAELDREVDSGTLTNDQASAARLEIQRRILHVADQKDSQASQSQHKFGLLTLIACVVPVLGFGFYLMLGRPDLPDLPHSARADQMRQMQDQQAMIAGMVQNLQARLAKNPEDGKGWAMLGRSLKVMGQADQAAEAYRKAMNLLPKDPNVRMEYASLLLAKVPQGSLLPPDFVEIMHQVVALAPDTLDALYFLGIAEAQAGHPAKAKEYWTKVLNALPADSPERADIQQQINELTAK